MGRNQSTLFRELMNEVLTEILIKSFVFWDITPDKPSKKAA
jgi:hypothetical protein